MKARTFYSIVTCALGHRHGVMLPGDVVDPEKYRTCHRHVTLKAAERCERRIGPWWNEHSLCEIDTVTNRVIRSFMRPDLEQNERNRRAQKENKMRVVMRTESGIVEYLGTVDESPGAIAAEVQVANMLAAVNWVWSVGDKLCIEEVSR